MDSLTSRTTFTRSVSDISLQLKPPPNELELMWAASIQLGAMKSLSVLLGCNRYVELLLVPKAEIVSEKKKLLEPSQVSRRKVKT